MVDFSKKLSPAAPVGTPRDPNELGALWIKTGGKGEYMTGMINGQPVVVFRNDRKQAGSNQPDWRVMKPQPKTPVGPEDDSGF